MKKRQYDLPEDPYDLFGISAEATDDEIRAAYLAKVREYPPDRATEFERIRDAYDILRDPRRRAEYLLFSGAGDLDFTSLIRSSELTRRFVGSRFWKEVLKGK